MNPKLRQALTQIFCTKIGLIVFTSVMAVIFGTIANETGSEWCTIIMYVCFALLVITALIFIVYGWIINPIRDLKERKKIQQENEEK